MESLIATLTALNNYLVHSGNENALKVHMEKYKADRDAFNRDFYKITLDRLDRLPDNTIITNLLTTMGIPKNQRGRYIHQEITVYQFLTELDATTKEPRLTPVIALIDEHNKTR
ncbi:MAG TPA: hypothetical protein DDY37_00095, partial [Legionella sp.]|nr:hypothetical protein [Legionella sp.]